MKDRILYLHIRDDQYQYSNQAVIVRKYSFALVVLRRAALVESKQTDDVGLTQIRSDS